MDNRVRRKWSFYRRGIVAPQIVLPQGRQGFDVGVQQAVGGRRGEGRQIGTVDHERRLAAGRLFGHQCGVLIVTHAVV